MPQDKMAPTTPGQLAYCFAGNVIAHATGSKLPRAMLTAP
jgi:hypothetical protein